MNDWSKLTLPDTYVQLLRAQANGADYEIRVWCPADSSSTARKLPVIYVLDGRDFYGTFVDSVKRLSRRPDATNVSPAIVVAVSPAADAENARDRRYADYTAGPPAEEPTDHHKTGGADAFHTFLRDELAPLIEEDFPADRKHRILFGHSLAGFFVLHTLATYPKTFSTYVAISPSIWWNEAALHEGIEQIEPHGKHVSIAVGEWEGHLPPWQRQHPSAEQVMQRRARRGMIERAQNMTTALNRLLGPDNVQFHIFPHEDHGSVVLVAIARALRFALGHDYGGSDSAAARTN